MYEQNSKDIYVTFSTVEWVFPSRETDCRESFVGEMECSGLGGDHWLMAKRDWTAVISPSDFTCVFLVPKSATESSCWSRKKKKKITVLNDDDEFWHDIFLSDAFTGKS